MLYDDLKGAYIMDHVKMFVVTGDRFYDGPEKAEQKMNEKLSKWRTATPKIKILNLQQSVAASGEGSFIITLTVHFALNDR
jgi:hypothetical protein